MRRARLQVKPIIGNATKREEVKNIPRTEVITVPPAQHPPTENQTVQLASTSTTNVVEQDRAPTQPQSQLSPFHSFAVPAVPSRKRLTSTCSNASTDSQRERRKFTGDEALDPKTMRMVDLITWNPKNEKKLDRAKLDNSESRSEMAREGARPAAVQVKLDASGHLVVDESSLLLDQTATQSAWDSVQDESMGARKINSASFCRWRRGTAWTDIETELFYEVLRATGPDFGLMHDLIPRRARSELKNKYNREEKYNWNKLNSVLSHPVLLCTEVYSKAAKMSELVEREEVERKEAKLARRETEKRLAKERKLEEKLEGERLAAEEARERERKQREVEWKEEEADLLQEAIDIINELECMDRNRKEQENKKKKKRSSKAQKLLDSSLVEVASSVEAVKEPEKKSAALAGYPE